MGDLLADLRYALRSLRRTPGFTFAAVLTVALGVGANTAMFSVLNGVLLRPLPYPGQERVVRVHNSWQGTPNARLSPAEYLDYRDGLDVFSAFGAYTYGSLNLTAVGEPVRLRAAFVAAPVFAALGATPAIGRVFSDREEATGQPVAVLGNGLWRERFGADPRVVGRTVTLNGRATEVVGVLGPEFRLPEALRADRSAAVFVPLGIDGTTVPARGSHYLDAVARLAPGVTPDQASAALANLAAGFVRDYPGDYPLGMALTAGAMPLADWVVGDTKPILLLLLGAVGLLLLIACANVANLSLARLDGRRRELAIRKAMGAPRLGLARSAVAESLAVCGLGGVVGILLAWWGTDLLVALRPPNIPRIGELPLDFRVVVFAVAVTLSSGVLAGILPAVFASDVRVAAVLRSGDRGVARGEGDLSRRALVVGQVAVALVLLAGAGLLGRSLLALRAVDPGFSPQQVLTTRLTLPSAAYPDSAAIRTFYQQLGRRIAEGPGVVAVGAVSNLPLATRLGDLNFRIEGRALEGGDVAPKADWQVVTPGYFAAMGLTLVRGRVIEDRDVATAPGVVVINETMARRYWPDADPLGRRLMLGGGAAPGWVTVVGVVRDVRHNSLGATPPTQFYLAHGQFRFWNGGNAVRSMTLAVRSGGEVAGTIRLVRQAVREIDPYLPLSDVSTMEEVLSASLGRERLLVWLVGTFALLALALGTVGIYGVIAYGVSRRIREIGVRVALGARATQVTAMVVRQGGRLALAGVAIGLCGALMLTRLLSGLLFEVHPLDPATLAAVAAVLASTALLASWIPARRAARVAPMEALRHE